MRLVPSTGLLLAGLLLGLGLPLDAFVHLWRRSYSEPMPGMRDLRTRKKRDAAR